MITCVVFVTWSHGAMRNSTAPPQYSVHYSIQQFARAPAIIWQKPTVSWSNTDGPCFDFLFLYNWSSYSRRTQFRRLWKRGKRITNNVRSCWTVHAYFVGSRVRPVVQTRKHTSPFQLLKPLIPQSVLILVKDGITPQDSSAVKMSS